jgi:hypothetical protein
LDEAEAVAVVCRAGDEKVGDCLWHEAQGAVPGWGEVNSVKVSIEPDVAGVELSEDAVLCAGAPIVHARDGFGGGDVVEEGEAPVSRG